MSGLHSPTWRAGTLVAALAATLAAGAAMAQDAPSIDPLRHIDPRDRPAYVRARIAEQEARRTAALGTEDTQGPVITGFNAPATLNVSRPEAPFRVAVKATDDLSGIDYCSFQAFNASGQMLTIFANAGYPRVNLSVTAGHQGEVSRLLVPGAWRFTFGWCRDVADNYGIAEGAALDALGNTAFTVSSGGYDLQAPTLTAGKIVTGSVSLSSTAPGTTSIPPSVGVRLDVADTTESVLSGVERAIASFCLASSPGTCITQVTGYMDGTGAATASLTAGSRINPAGLVPGDYLLKDVVVRDHAGNSRTYLSTLFGGDTDFTPLFAGVAPRIKLKP